MRKKASQQQQADPFMGLGPGREIRVRVFKLLPGESHNQDLANISSTPDKYRPVSESMTVNPDGSVIIVIKYAEGGLASEAQIQAARDENIRLQAEYKAIVERQEADLKQRAASGDQEAVDLMEMLREQQSPAEHFDDAASPAVPSDLTQQELESATPLTMAEKLGATPAFDHDRLTGVGGKKIETAPDEEPEFGAEDDALSLITSPIK